VLKKVEKPDRFAETWRAFLTALLPELSPRQIAFIFAWARLVNVHVATRPSYAC